MLITNCSRSGRFLIASTRASRMRWSCSGQRVGLVVGHVAVEVVVVALVAAHVLEVDQLRAAHLAQQLLVLLEREAHLLGDLAFVGRAAQALLELVHGGLDGALLAAVAAAHPVVAAQFVEHGAADALGGEGLELHALRGVEAASARPTGRSCRPGSGRRVRRWPAAWRSSGAPGGAPAGCTA
jgi:hypothetical protein